MAMRINRFALSDLTAAERLALTARARPDWESVQERVNEIVDRVRKEGDRALLEFTSTHDGVELSVDRLRVTPAEFDEAEERVSPPLRAALERVVGNIRAHHQAQMPVSSWMKEVAPGVLSGERTTPIASVGLYVPRGKGSFPSVMAMLCVPAALAGVPRVAVCTPPGPGGSADAASLTVARMCGVTEVFRVGGAQAIAALAFGTGTIGRVEKIVGPGSLYVSAAKRLVYGHVDPGPPAGPSESIVLADAHADPQIVARELLVEAEHGPDSAALLVTDSGHLADLVEPIVVDLVAALPQPRRSFCEAVLGGLGGIVVASGMDEALEFVNTYAPEHLRVLVADPFSTLHRVRHAGEVLLGPHTSIPLGNYAIGVNAVLPTGGTARSYSCVGVGEFLKRSSFACVSPAGLRGVATAAVELARYEGFPAHAEAAAYVLRHSDGDHPHPGGNAD